MSDNEIAESTDLSKVIRFALGVDPGTATGVALYDYQEDRILWVKTTTFWGLHDLVVRDSKYLNVFNTRIVFEIPKVSGGFQLYHRFKSGGSEEVKQGGPQSKVAANIGANAREGTLLAQRFADLGFDVWSVKPPKKAKKWDKDDLERETGYTGLSSEHGRDAARVAWRFDPEAE
jgi:hypothetical protein